eukprot:4242254-Lingulodinium_polyedra.AAC.1
MMYSLVQSTVESSLAYANLVHNAVHSGLGLGSAQCSPVRRSLQWCLVYSKIAQRAVEASLVFHIALE